MLHINLKLPRQVEHIVYLRNFFLKFNMQSYMIDRVLCIVYLELLEFSKKRSTTKFNLTKLNILFKLK